MSITQVGLSQPLSLSATVDVCSQSALSQKDLQTRPLRVLVPRVTATEYEVIPYQTGKPYFAISYVWPSPYWRRLYSSNEPSTIATAYASVKSMHVSQFASNVIRLMLSVAERPDFGVWVDHECIDQTDEVEKNQQIAIMDQIYHNARYTAILLEDVELSVEELTFLKSPAAWRDDRQRYVVIVRRLLGARWFTRAWCSQEMVLSRSSEIFMHQLGLSDEPLQINYWSFASYVTKAAILDPTLRKLAEPRGIVKSDCKITWHTTAWAWGIVHIMNCFNEFDKVALVQNMTRSSSRVAGLPSKNGCDASVDNENICKIINVLAILRQDLSLLLTGHSVSARLGKSLIFSWAAYPIPSDLTAETWHPNRYVDATQKNKLPYFQNNYLVLQGFADQVTAQESWCVFEEDSKLFACVDNVTHHITSRWPGRRGDQNWAGADDFERNRSLRWLRNVLLAILQLGRTDLFCNFTAPDDAPRSTSSWMEVYEDLEDEYRGQFARATHFHSALGAQMNLIENGGRIEFLQLELSSGGKMTAFGNVSKLVGKTIMQPHGMRPKTFDNNIFTVNALVLDDSVSSKNSSGESRFCCGGLRCFQMLPEELGEITIQVR